jgi:hypothetical protein
VLGPAKPDPSAGHDEGLREITPYLWVHPDEER